MSRSSFHHLRPLLPANEAPQLPPPTKPDPKPRRAAVIAACQRCRERKVKCDGNRPTCKSCAAARNQCVYVTAEAESHQQALKRKYEDLENEVESQRKLFHFLQTRPEDEADAILKHIRRGGDAQSIVRLVEQGDLLRQVALVPETRYRYEFPLMRDLPEFLRRGDNPYLHSPIFEWKVGGESGPSQGPTLLTPPAPYMKPYFAAEVVDPMIDAIEPSKWTLVCSDNALLRRILSSYFLHEYDWFTFFHKDYFLQDMAKGRRRFCSELLVNAMYALACYCCPELPDRDQFWNPQTLGHRFLAEAKRLWEIQIVDNTKDLTTIQAAMLLNLVYNMTGADEIGWLYTVQAVAMAQDLHLFTGSSSKTRDPKVQIVRDFTAWALFSWQSLHSYHFFSKPLVETPPKASLPDPSRNPQWYGEIWLKYPLSSALFPTGLGRLFRSKAEFLAIVNDIACRCFGRPGEQPPQVTEQEILRFHSRLETWYTNLPEGLSPTGIVLPSQIKLHLHYFYLVKSIHKHTVDSLQEQASLTTLGETATGKWIRSVFSDANIRFETLLRIYYLRHGFEGLDSFMLAFLVPLGLASNELLIKSRDAAEIETLRSTLLLCARGLREQGRIYFLSQTMFHVLHNGMRPEEKELFGRFMHESEDDGQQPLRTEYIRSQWPITTMNITEDPEKRRLGLLIREFEDLSTDAAEKEAE